MILIPSGVPSGRAPPRKSAVLPSTWQAYLAIVANDVLPEEQRSGAVKYVDTIMVILEQIATACRIVAKNQQSATGCYHTGTAVVLACDGSKVDLQEASVLVNSGEVVVPYLYSLLRGSCQSESCVRRGNDSISSIVLKDRVLYICRCAFLHAEAVSGIALHRAVLDLDI